MHRLGLEVLDDRCLPSTFTVLNLLDSGPDSLRAAVAAANANPGADDIAFAVTGSIGLTSGQLDITDSLTINGPGESALTVSGEGVSRVFGIAGAPTVVIANLTLANGKTWGSPGGGISMAGGNLTLDHVTVSGNYAFGVPGAYGEGGGGLGGGLFVWSGTLTLNQSTVSGNYAVGAAGYGGQGEGAGLYVVGGTVNVNESTVAGNHALGGAGGDIPGGISEDDPWAGAGGAAEGGGIRIAAGTVVFYQSTVADNTAVGGRSGAGSWAYSGAPGAGEGGGLSITGGTLTLDQSTVSGNSAVGGAGSVEYNGWYWNFGSTGGRGEGGGLHVAGGTVAVNLTTVSGNQALGGAGGQTAIDVTYGGAGGAAAGGGIRVAAGTVQLTHSTVSGNTADGGSGGSGFYNGTPGVGVGGGLNISPASPPLADLDTFTESHAVNNFADIDPNISGPYSLNGTFVCTLAISDVTTAEGNTGTTAFVFTVSLSAPSNQAVSINYATADATSTAGRDYQAGSGTLTIPAGQTTGTITVLVNGDRLSEPNETFVVNLSNPTNATIADGKGVGTIMDDEPRISISDVSKKEGKKNQTTLFTFTVTLSTAYDQAVTMSFRTVNGTATTSDSDYVSKAGSLTFNPGETTKTITIEVKGDSKKEGDETFYLDLFGNSSNSLFTKNRGIGTIVNDD
jgi:hypothetical protein